MVDPAGGCAAHTEPVKEVFKRGTTRFGATYVKQALARLSPQCLYNLALRRLPTRLTGCGRMLERCRERARSLRALAAGCDAETHPCKSLYLSPVGVWDLLEGICFAYVS